MLRNAPLERARTLLRRGPTPPASSGYRRSMRRERHRAGACRIVGDDVDERDHALIDFLLRALQRGADVFRFFHVLTVAAQRFGHLVEAGVAEVAADFVSLR